MRKAITWRPHRHRVHSVQPGHIELDGPGAPVTLQLCSCTAWRVEGTHRWKGSNFRRQHGEAAVR